MPFIRGCVTQQTLVKCGQRMMPMISHQKNLLRSGHWPNVAKKWCPSSKDFVSLQTLTKCGPNFAPHWRTLSRRGLWPNVVHIVPLVGGLCHAADFDQMWSKMCPSSEDFVSLRGLRPNVVQTFHPCWKNLSRSGLQPNVVQTCVPWWRTSFCYGVRPCMDQQRDHHWKRPVPNNWILIIDQCETETASPITLPYDQYTKRYSSKQALTKKWRISYPSCDKWQMMWITHKHHQYSIVLDERGKHSYSIYLD